MHRWPEVPNAPHSTPSTARSRSASSIIITTFLPPISSEQILSFAAAAWPTMRPTSVEPVKEINRTCRVIDERRARLFAAPGDDVEHARRHARLFASFDEVVGRKRRVFGGLDDDGVAADERGHDLPRGNRHREIPGRYQPAHAYRLARAHRVLVRQLGLCREAVQSAALARDEVGHVDGFLHVAARLFQDLAHLARHRARELFFAPDQNLARP